MGRSVMVPSNAVSVIYLDCSDFEDQWEFDDFIEDLRAVIRSRFRSFENCEEWVGREERAILENDHGKVVVAEYCGLASVSLVPNHVPDYYSDGPARNNLAESWCERISFRQHLAEKFKGMAFAKMGTFSNGNSVYKRIE